MKFAVMALLASFLFAGCAKSENSPPVSTGRPIANAWNSSDGYVINFTGATFDSYSLAQVTKPNGAICSCNAYITGSEAAGEIGLSQCTYVSGGTGDPPCSGLSLNGTYSKNSTGLTLCLPFCFTLQ